MKVTCPISGIVYQIGAELKGAAIHPHPLLSSSIATSTLVSTYIPDWAQGNLSTEVTHLVGIALLKRLPVDSIALPPLSDSHLTELQTFWGANLESIAKMAARLDGKVIRSRHLPKMVVTKETMGALPEWLKTLRLELGAMSAPISDKARELNKLAYKVSETTQGRNAASLLTEEEVDGLVLRALRGSLLDTREVKALPVILADWACKVTDFPHHSRMRWQKLIQTIFNADYINQILMSDMTVDTIKALEEHLMLNTPAEAVGTSHSTLLMKRIADVIPVLEDFNPVVSKRRNVSNAAVISAIMGDDGDTSQSKPAPKPKAPIDPNAPKKLSLHEMLAARLGKKVSELPQ